MSMKTKDSRRSSGSSKDIGVSKSSTQVKDIDLANEDFEVLNFYPGKSTNIVRFKESAFDYLNKELGAVARVIKDCIRYEPPLIEDPVAHAFTAANDPFGSKKASYLGKISNREDAIAVLQSKESQLFSHLWNNLSKESKAQVERVQQQQAQSDGVLVYVDVNGDECEEHDVGARAKMETWDEVYGSDALSLIRRINTTHLSPDTGVNGLNEEQTRMRYERLHQYSGETILDFKRRFQHALDAMKSVGLPAIPPTSIATRFIINLDNSRYASFKAEITNWAKNGIKPYPQTLEEAFESASTYKDASPSAPTTTGTAYVIHDKPYSGSGRGRGYGRGRGPPHHSGTHQKSNDSRTKASDTSSYTSHQSTKASVCTKPCPICSEMHWQRYCPIVAAAKAMHLDEDYHKSSKSGKDGKVHVVFSRATVSTRGHIMQHIQVGKALVIPEDIQSEKDSHDIFVSQRVRDMPSDRILLDNQASVSVFGNVDLLSNLRDAPYTCQINGISADGESISATQIGDFNGVKDIYACPQAAANIISFSETRKYCENNYDKDKDIFSSTPPRDKTYNFIGDEGLYVCQINNEDIFINTVFHNKQMFSIREQRDAEKAKELSKTLGYPSPRSLMDMLNNGSIINCPITSKDIARANQIFGPDLGSVRGKTRKQKIPHSKAEYLPREMSSDLVLNIDLMFVNSNAYLISVSTPLGLTMFKVQDL